MARGDAALTGGGAGGRSGSSERHSTGKRRATGGRSGSSELGGTTGPVARIDITQRRARLALQHRLAPTARAKGPGEAAASVIGLHATDPATVYLAARARLVDRGPDVIDRMATALYDERTLIRMLGVRRTMWVLPDGFAPTMQAAATRAIEARERKRLLGMLADAGIGEPDPDTWLTDVEDSVLRALERRGEASANTLAGDEPRLRSQVVYSPDKAYGGPAAITSRLLNLMSTDGRIVRGRVTGPWTSTRYAWAPATAWLPSGFGDLPVDDARRELIRRWLESFGPGTLDDLTWWTGWGKRDVRAALDGLPVVEVELTGGANGPGGANDPGGGNGPGGSRSGATGSGTTGLLLESDLAPVEEPEPWVALLPALDPTAMGWKDRDWYLSPAYRPKLFDRSGNIGPTIWADGRIVGGWGQRASGAVAYELLEDIGSEATCAVAAEAEELDAWLRATGEVVIKPRFRTPLEQAFAST